MAKAKGGDAPTPKDPKDIPGELLRELSIEAALRDIGERLALSFYLAEIENPKEAKRKGRFIRRVVDQVLDERWKAARERLWPELRAPRAAEGR